MRLVPPPRRLLGWNRLSSSAAWSAMGVGVSSSTLAVLSPRMTPEGGAMSESPATVHIDAGAADMRAVDRAKGGAALMRGPA